MTTAIEGVYFKDLLIPFIMISLFVAAVVLLTGWLVRKELKNEKNN